MVNIANFPGAKRVHFDKYAPGLYGFKNFVQSNNVFAFL